MKQITLTESDLTTLIKSAIAYNAIQPFVRATYVPHSKGLFVQFNEPVPEDAAQIEAVLGVDVAVKLPLPTSRTSVEGRDT